MGTFTDFPVPSATDWSRAGKIELVDSLHELESLMRHAQAAQGAILAEVQSRGVSPTFGYTTAEALLHDVVQCTRADGQRRVRRALACHDHSEGTRRVPATAPAMAAAFEHGEINTAHVDSIITTLAEIPGQVPDEDRKVYEKILVELAAKSSHPSSVTKAGRHLLRRLEQEYLSPDPPTPVHPERELNWNWSVDGRLYLKGILDAVSGAQLLKLLSPLAKPRPGEDGERDPRGMEERNGDALAELIAHAQRAANLPTEAGEATALTVTMTLNDLRGHATCQHGATDRDSDGSDSGDGTSNESGYDRVNAIIRRQLPLLNADTPISVEEARLLACDARIIPAVLGGDGEVFDLGRAQRLANTPQRRALALRDKGCVFPSCTRPANWTEAHHIAHWHEHHGSTDLDNLALLCGMHHRLIHNSDWTIRMADDGKPECLPPTWLDASQRPRRNNTFDPFLSEAA